LKNAKKYPKKIIVTNETCEGKNIRIDDLINKIQIKVRRKNRYRFRVHI
jgi:hypothetical protein